MKKILIDCDPGIDDAIALLFAFSEPEFEILGVTTAQGNVPAQMSCRNALRIAEYAGRTEIPVFEGRNIKKSLEFNSSCHGLDGIGDCGLPEPARAASEGSQEDFLLETLRKNDAGTVTIVALGPMTNLAAALQKDSECFHRVKEIYSMGGGLQGGNVTPNAEFNYWFDAKAARAVYDSRAPLSMIGLDAADPIEISPVAFEQIGRKDGRNAKLVARMLPVQFAFIKKMTGREFAVPYDLIALTACLNPELFQWKTGRIAISTVKKTWGQSVMDEEKVAGCTRRAAASADKKAFFELLEQFLAR